MQECRRQRALNAPCLRHFFVSPNRKIIILLNHLPIKSMDRTRQSAELQPPSGHGYCQNPIISSVQRQVLALTPHKRATWPR